MPLPTLAQRLMRGAGAVAAFGLLLAALAAAWSLRQDVQEEAQAAQALAQAMQTVAALPRLSDAEALAALAALRNQPPLRHLRLTLSAEGGAARAPLLQWPPMHEAPQRFSQRLERWLVGGWPAAEGWGLAPERLADAPLATWRIERPQGGAWRVHWHASHRAERAEALVGGLQSWLLAAATLGAVLLAMRRVLRRALAPLGTLAQAMAALERGERAAALAPPAMHTRELQSLAAALSHLAQALAQAEAERRALAARMASLQEDERRHLARELHDELGQRLTALRVDAAWLGQRLAAATAEPAGAAASAAPRDELRAVVQGMADQCAALQDDVRAMLHRLQPLGPLRAADGTAGLAGLATDTLQALLQTLVDGWGRSPGAGAGQGLRATFQPRWRPDAASPWQPWPQPPRALAEAEALALYRLSQEALTNVARHAQAQRVELGLDCTGGWQPGAELELHWWAQDDGRGLPQEGALAPGRGLVGMRDRIWALGGRWHQGSRRATAQGDAAASGTRLEAWLRSAWRG